MSSTHRDPVLGHAHRQRLARPCGQNRACPRGPKPSPIAAALGGIDAFEAAAMDGIAAGRLDARDVMAVLHILRGWCEQGFGRR